MTLDKFKQKLSTECHRLYSDLRDGSRLKKLQKKQGNSLKDIVYMGKSNPSMLLQSCLISYGKALEVATMSYAKEMGAKVYNNKKFLSSDVDIVFRIKTMVYNLESKSNIELDLGKSKKALETLQRKHKIVFNGLDCHTEKWIVLSKFVVWTKETSKDAEKVAKKPITEKYLMGFKDFFELFHVNVNKDDFFKVLQDVWEKEVEEYF